MFFSISFGRFYGIDSLIEFLIIIVSLIISLYSRRIYKIIKDKNYRFFSWAFLAIAISFVFKILSNFTIVNRIKIEGVNFAYIIFSQPRYMPIVDFLTFILYKAFYLSGLLILFFIVSRTKDREKIFLFVYLSAIAVLFSIYFNFVFHITLIFLLLFLTLHFYDNYKEHRTTNSLLVFIAFLVVLLSHLSFAFSDIYPLFYLIGEGFLLIGFLSLLVNQIKIKLKYKNDKTNKARGNKRYSRNLAKK